MSALSAISVPQVLQIIGSRPAPATPTPKNRGECSSGPILLPMIPLRDVVPSRTIPGVTVGLIALSTLVFFYEMLLSRAEMDRLVLQWGLVPGRASPFTWLTSMFLHDGWVPFLGNMLYLWIFGETVEDRFGHGRFLFFYLVSGVIAGTAHELAAQGSSAPLVGAVGAVAGVLGAHLVMFPQSRALTLVPLVLAVRIIEVPAALLIAVWFALQFASGLGTLSAAGHAGGGATTFWAQAAGFAGGMALSRAFRQPERETVEWWDDAQP